MKASWNGRIVVESDDTVVVEGNYYFPGEAIAREFFEKSSTTSLCPWKGEASYYHLHVDGQRNEDAAWTYPDPKAAAEEIRDRVAFWKDVVVE